MRSSQLFTRDWLPKWNRGPLRWPFSPRFLSDGRMNISVGRRRVRLLAGGRRERFTEVMSQAKLKRQRPCCLKRKNHS